MIELFFTKPKYAVIKIDNKLIDTFPYIIEYEKPFLLEFLPVNCDFIPFSEVISMQNNKLIVSQNIEITIWDNEHFSISYLPKINNRYDLNIEKILTGDDKNIALVKDNIYHIFVYHNNDLMRVINLPDYIRYPNIHLTNDFIILTAHTIYNQKYILLVDKQNLKPLLNKVGDAITTEPNGLAISHRYHDTLMRTADYIYSYDDFSLQAVDFTYNNDINKDNFQQFTLNCDSNDIDYSELLPTLFIEAYIAKDISKINEYLFAPVNYSAIYEYFGDITIENCPYKHNYKNSVFISYKEKNIKIIKRVTFSIIDYKIDTFELL